MSHRIYGAPHFNPPNVGGVPVFNDLYETQSEENSSFSAQPEQQHQQQQQQQQQQQKREEEEKKESSLPTDAVGPARNALKRPAPTPEADNPEPHSLHSPHSPHSPAVASSTAFFSQAEKVKRASLNPSSNAQVESNRGSGDRESRESHNEDVHGEENEMRRRKIFIGSLPPSWTEKPLQQHFAAFGAILDCRVVRDRSTGISRGFAFLTFVCESSAEKALQTDRHVVEGKAILVSPVRTTSDNGGGPSEAESTSTKPPHLRGKSTSFWEDIVLPNQRRIYIGPLAENVTPSDLARQFGLFGVIQGISRLRGSGTTTSQVSYGFIDFQENVSIRRAFASKVFVHGRHVKVALSRLAMEVALSDSTVYFFEAHVYCDESHLEKHFSPLGSIYRCLHLRQPNGTPRSFGFVDFLDKTSAERACLNKSQLMHPGQFVRVSRFLPQRYLWEFFAIGDTEANDIIKEMEKKIPEEGSWGASNLRGLANLTNPPKTKQVRIPTEMLPCLIGERGKTIAEICRDSKTQITLPKADPGNPNVILTLKGTESDLVTAQYLMQKILKAKKANSRN